MAKRMRTKKEKLAPAAQEALADRVTALYLDFGCGPNPRIDRDIQGNVVKTFEGVDQFPFDGKVKHVMNVVEPIYAPIKPGFEWMADSFERKVIGHKPWPWADSSVDEAHASHFVEHLTNFHPFGERVHFFNELWRVLKPGGTAHLVTPDWACERYYGDPTHKESFSPFAFHYLSKNWRTGNAPHASADVVDHMRAYRCNFDAQGGFFLDAEVNNWPDERKNYATKYHINARSDMFVTLIAVKEPSPVGAGG
jgi:predicted SAM-dependent methyltransferase